MRLKSGKTTEMDGVSFRLPQAGAAELSVHLTHIGQLESSCLILELQRKAESYFQHTKSTFSSDTRQIMKRRILAKHLTEP